MKRTLFLIIIAVLLAGLVGGFFLGIGIWNARKGPNIAKSTGALGTLGTGCFLSDRFFTDTSLADDIDGTIAKIVGKYSTAKSKEQYFREILEKGKAVSVNPAIPIGIWYGEQSFGNPDEAFGQGNYDNGQNVIKGWPAELAGVYETIQEAIDNRGYYTKPANTNIMTRLFYNYASAMQTQYKESSGVWDEKYKHPKYGNPYYNRLNVIRFLVPNQVECQSQTILAGISGSGASTCDGVTPKYLTRSSANQGTLGVPKVIILHYLGYRGTSNTGEYLTVQQAYNYFNGDKKHVQYVISKEGGIYQFSPENRSAAGALDYNQPSGDYGSGAIAIQIENEGQFEDARDKMQETSAQVQANISLVRCLMKKYNISLENVTIETSNTKAKEPYNVISHKEADARGGADKGKRGSRRSDPGTRFMDKVLKGLK